jgi:hypothetical protein
MIISSSGKQVCPECGHDMFRTEIARKIYDLNTKESDYVMSIGGDLATYEENGSASTSKKIVCDKCGLVLKSYRA